MRPRLITAENPCRKDNPACRFGASMRPRLITAENDWVDSWGEADDAVLQ